MDHKKKNVLRFWEDALFNRNEVFFYLSYDIEFFDASFAFLV